MRGRYIYLLFFIERWCDGRRWILHELQGRELDYGRRKLDRFGFFCWNDHSIIFENNFCGDEGLDTGFFFFLFSFYLLYSLGWCHWVNLHGFFKLFERVCVIGGKHVFFGCCFRFSGESKMSGAEGSYHLIFTTAGPYAAFVVASATAEVIMCRVGTTDVKGAFVGYNVVKWPGRRQILQWSHLPSKFTNFLPEVCLPQLN